MYNHTVKSPKNGKLTINPFLAVKREFPFFTKQRRYIQVGPGKLYLSENFIPPQEGQIETCQIKKLPFNLYGEKNPLGNLEAVVVEDEAIQDSDLIDDERHERTRALVKFESLVGFPTSPNKGKLPCLAQGKLNCTSGYTEEPPHADQIFKVPCRQCGEMLTAHWETYKYTNSNNYTYTHWKWCEQHPEAGEISGFLPLANVTVLANFDKTALLTLPANTKVRVPGKTEAEDIIITWDGVSLTQDPQGVFI